MEALTRRAGESFVQADARGGFMPRGTLRALNPRKCQSIFRISGREAKTATARGTSRHIYRQTRQSEQQFRPPQTKPPSQYRQNTPIPATILISGGCNCTGRAKTSPKKGATGKYAEVRTGKAGESFVQADAGGGFMPRDRISEHQGARPVKDVGIVTEGQGESLIRVGAVGIRIWKTPPRFPNYLGRRTNFPPHPQFSDTQGARSVKDTNGA